MLKFEQIAFEVTHAEGAPTVLDFVVLRAIVPQLTAFRLGDTDALRESTYSVPPFLLLDHIDQCGRADTRAIQYRSLAIRPSQAGRRDSGHGPKKRASEQGGCCCASRGWEELCPQFKCSVDAAQLLFRSEVIGRKDPQYRGYSENTKTYVGPSAVVVGQWVLDEKRGVICETSISSMSKQSAEPKEC